MIPRFHFDPLRTALPATVTRERIDVWVSGWSVNATEQNGGGRIINMTGLLRQLEGRFPAKRRPAESRCRTALVDELWGLAREFGCDPTSFTLSLDQISAKARHAACRDIEMQIEAMGLHRTARSHGVRQHLENLFERSRLSNHDDPLRDGYVLAATTAFMMGLGPVSADVRKESLAMCLEEMDAVHAAAVPQRDRDPGTVSA